MPAETPLACSVSGQRVSSGAPPPMRRHQIPGDRLNWRSKRRWPKVLRAFRTLDRRFETVDMLKSMGDESALGIRLWVMLREGNDALAERGAEYRMVGYGDNRLTVRAIKRSIDGALGSRGAWMLEPYTDLPDSTGLNTTSPESIAETAAWAIDNDFQLCVHAIGDRGNREVLDIYAATFEANPDKTDLRWRDEHTQHLHPDDISRFGELGVIASMQGVHATSDAPFVVPRLGEQRAEKVRMSGRA